MGVVTPNTSSVVQPSCSCRITPLTLLEFALTKPDGDRVAEKWVSHLLEWKSCTVKGCQWEYPSQVCCNASCVGQKDLEHSVLLLRSIPAVRSQPWALTAPAHKLWWDVQALLCKHVSPHCNHCPLGWHLDLVMSIADWLKTTRFSRESGEIGQDLWCTTGFH